MRRGIHQQRDLSKEKSRGKKRGEKDKTREILNKTKKKYTLHVYKEIPKDRKEPCIF